MAFLITWSEFAEAQLVEIYEYYEKMAGLAVATKLIREILNEPNKLIKSPFLSSDKKKNCSRIEKSIIGI
jgi:plasmid stabilization system protein ParE